jgi:hypothetical protein
LLRSEDRRDRSAYRQSLRRHETRILCLLGVLAAQREPSKARAHYQRALALADTLRLRPLAAHAHLGLGMLFARARQREPARAALAAATQLYRGMEMSYWDSRATAVLTKLA